jgi:hypothetical protein
MKKLLISIAAASMVFATEFAPYVSYIDYSKNTSKDYAGIAGIYISQYESPYKVEVDGEYMQLKFKDSPAYKQSDLTLIVNYFFRNNYKFRVGIHNIFASNPETITTYKTTKSWHTSTTTSTTTTRYNNSYDYVLFGGITYYQYLKFDANMNVYYSSYENLDVYQASPSFGYAFGDYYSTIGSFYAKATLNYINLSNSDAAPKDNYVNVDLQLKNYKGPWVTALEASVGKTAYKVAKEGFVVYNLGEEYKDGYSLSIGRKLQNNDFINFSVNYSEFEETEGYSASSTSYLINYTHNF